MFTGNFETELPTLDIVLRLVLAVLFGAVIGFERERRQRPAGLRTHMMVSLAAAVFTLLTAEIIFESTEVGDPLRLDPIRLIEAVTAGVAFLGAGTIIQSRGEIKGITTGTGMWLAGAIGVACGGGFYIVAGIATVLGLFILIGVGHVEQRYMKPDRAEE